MSFNAGKAISALCIAAAIGLSLPVCAQDVINQDAVNTENLEKPLIVKEEAKKTDNVTRIYLRNEEVLAGEITDITLKFMVMQSEFNIKIADMEKADLEDDATVILRNGDRVQVIPAFETISFEHQATKAKMSIPTKEIVRIEFAEKATAEMTR